MKKFDKGKTTDILALTPMQEGMLFHYLKEPEGDYYFEQLSVKVSGNLNINCFERAWHIVIETNEMLRTVFRWEKLENPVQVVLKESPIKFKYHDVANEPEGINKGRLEEIKIKDRRKAFDLREVPFRVTLCRIEQGRYEIIISNHHILYDGWSTGIILKEFLAAYTDLVNKQIPAKPVKTLFKEFVKRTLAKDRVKKEETFWKNHLKGFDTPLEFSIKKSPGKEGKKKESQETGDYQAIIEKDIKDCLERYSKEYKITLAALLYSAWGILLQKYNHTNDAIFGTTVSGRNIQLKGIADMVGLFINTVPLRVKAIPGEKVKDFLIRINHQMKEREKYEHSPLVDIKGYSDIGTNEEMFDTVLVIENYPLGQRLKQENSALSFDSHSIFERSHYDLTLGITLGDQVVVRFYYQEELFNHAHIRRLSQHYSALIETLTDNPGQEITDIDMLSLQEKQQILVDFNATDTDYPQDKTIHQLFEQQVAKTPDNIALISMEHGARSMERDGGLQHLSYRELNEISDQLACLLMEKGMLPGAIAAIMLERSVEMIIGILTILKAGGAYLPIDPDYPEERKQYILADSRAILLITTRALTEKVGKVGRWEGKKIFIDEYWNRNTTTRLSRSPSRSLHAPCSMLHASPGSLAYIMYTSGTTGRPKGVMVEHRNVVRLVKNTNYIHFQPQDRLLQTGALEFDASTFEIWGTLLNGTGLVLVNKETILNPGKLKKVIKTYFISIMWMTSSLFNQVGDIELFGGLTYLLVGGDVLSPPHIDRVRKAFPRLNVINGYGPTENTTFSTTYLIADNDSESNKRIPIGTPISNSSAYIVDRTDHFVPVGVPGELLVGGDGVARGYLNNPGLTAERFVRINRSYRSYRSYISYRTGDLARWLPDGSIDFLGRIDLQVKIRGFRIELEGIRNLLLKHKNVEDVAVIAKRDETGENHICAYVVPTLVPASSPGAGSAHIPQLRQWLAEKLPGYMIPTHFIVLEQLPLTPNGKLDRRALPVPEIMPGKAYHPPRDKQEQALVAMWSEVLGIEKEKIGIDDNFFELGGHSLKATALVTRIHKHCDIEVPLSQLFHAPTVRQLSSYIQKTNRQKQLVIESSEEKEYYELTAAQKRFFIFQQMEPDSVSYNMPKTLRLEGKISKEEFEGTFKQLSRRHESLWTFFELVDGEPVQRVLNEKDVIFEIESDHIALTSDEQQVWAANRGKPEKLLAIERDFLRPFNLSRPPLMRVRLVKAGPELYFLLFDMHHIITDGVSIGIFIKEFLALYNREALPELPAQYRDYVKWEKQNRTRDAAGGAAGQEQVSPGDVLNLPTDYVRPAVPTFEGDTIIFELDEQIKKALILMALKQQDATVYMILLSVFYILLSKLSGQDSIVVGSPMAGRLHQDLEGLIGLFINTLVLRNFPSGEKAFSEFLAEVKENALQAFDNQEYQYEQLIDAFAAARETGRNPLFDVMFAYQNMEIPEVEIPGMKVFMYPEQGWSSKFDMTLYCEEHNNYLFKWEYSTKLFKPETIRRFSRYFKKITSEILADPHKRILEIEILSAEEKQQILYDFNDTSVEYPRGKTIPQWFEEQTGQTPERTAVIGTEHGAWSMADHVGTRFIASASYRELNEKSNQLARLLRRRGIKANTAAGIMMERSTWALVAIYAVLKAGGAYLPIDPEYPDNRIIGMLEKSGASLLLTTREIADKKSLHSLSEGQEILVLDEAEQSEELERESSVNLEPVSGPGDLIYIIFTSGSTGTPKGAGVYHRGFMNLVHWFVTEFQLDGSDRNLLLTSLSFDLTQKNLYAPLVTGGTLCIPRFNYFEPHSLLREIHEHRVTWINCTPSMFYKMVEYESAGEEKRLTLLRYVFLGGEPISMLALIDWLESEHCHAELVNTYGPTECTDISNYYRVKNPRQFLEQNIPVGYPVYNVQLFVPDKYLQPVPVGVPGELLIGGVSVGIGYINDRELTAQKFIKHSFVGEPERLLYRTGDLVRWLPEGTIEFLGRIDHQVKVRGFRIELGEIESQLLNHPKVKETVVMARQGEGGPDDTYLCAYVIPVPPHTPGTPDALQAVELREHLAAELPDYMVPPYFVMLEKLPLNPNGKVDRKALPEPDRTADRDYVPPRNEREKVLVGIWSEVLGVPGNQISVHDNFFRLGGHSLKAAALVAQIHKAFSVEIPIVELFKRPTVEGIGRHIEKSEESIYSALNPVEKREYYPLSSAQKRLYLLYRLDTGSTAYNIPEALVLEGDVERERLENTFIQLITRHESLRTSFEMLAEEPVQKIHENVDFEIEYYSAAPDPLPLISQFIRPFDLFRAPLTRVGLVQIEKEKYLLLMDMHHIISDAISRDIFIRDFTALYSGSELSPLKVTYKDYSEWQNRKKESIKQQEDFWIGEFEDEIPVLELPADYTRPTVQSFEGSQLSFYLEEKESQALKQLALEQEATLYMILMALYNILLFKLSGQEDIVVGSPIAGRRHANLEQIIGMFVNTLPLRNYPSAENRFSEFLRDVRERTLIALENQDYPFENLVDKVAVKRDISRNPLFDVVFVMQNAEVSEIQLPGLTLTPLSYEPDTSKFDITFIAFEAGKGLGFLFEYGTKLFKEDSIRRFVNYFKKIVTDILEHPHIKLSDIEIISEEEKRQILVDFNNTVVDYPEDKTIHQLFKEQVARTPDGIAVVGMERFYQWTYRQLNTISNHLADLLLEKGGKPGSIVGIIGGRSPEMVSGILGILKIGGVYLPIDADYPAERQRYMLDDSNAGLLVSGGIEVIAGEHPPTQQLTDSPTQLAYIMYTSGSTGRPKGVLVTHRNVVRLVKNTNYVLLNQETRVLQTGAPVFDATTFEIWGSLLNGGQLVLTSKEVILDAHRLGDAMEAYSINTLWLSAPLFNQLMQQNIDLFSPLRYLLVGGDTLSPAHINRVKQKFPHLNIINGYGPTENTTFSTTYLIEKEFEQNIPIGSPIANSSAYILDKHNHLQPIGIYGQLQVGGDGLSLGYLNNPELTAEKFKFNRSYRSYRSYKTGDLARWLPDGNIEFSGRIDQQVKIRGFRVEPGEIEDHLLKIDRLKETVVIPVQDEKGNNSLCAYIVADNEIPVTELRNALSRQLPDYMIPSYFTFLEKIPLTSNGKVDRKTLPLPRVRVTGVYTAPRNEIEKRMTEVWSGVLGIDSETIGIDSDFFEMGGDSLKATILVSKIHQAFNVKIPLAQVFQAPMIRGLTEYMKEAVEETFLSIEPVGKKDYYFLSSAQKRLYILQQVDPESTVYHISTAVRLEGNLEKEKLENVFIQLIHRHESLRTSFAVVADEAVQEIHEDVAFEIEYYESNRVSLLGIPHFVRPFDLSTAPLLRVRLIKEDNTRHLLMVDMHHIISDGTSMGVLVHELMALYNGDMLPVFSIQYKDFSEWQNSAKQQESIKQQEGFWLWEFEGEIPVLNFPTDYKRPTIQGFEGSTIGFEMAAGETRVLRQCSLNEGVTLFMFLFALYNILLAKISSQEEIVVGTPVAGRSHAELQPLIGAFINTLPLKNHPCGEKTFNEFLREIKEKTLAAFANQEYPYEDLVDQIVVHRDASRNPLFDALFAFQNADISEMEIPGLKLLPYEYERNTSKFDLSLYGHESGEGLAFAFEYSTNLFKRETVERIICYFKKLTAAVLENTRQRIANIEILSEAEKHQLLEGFNAAEAAYPRDKTIHELFEQQSARSTDKIALLGMASHQLTYGQLNEKSHQLAEGLRKRGVTPNTIVGIKTDRSLEMVINIFGILKAGAAYLPIDPAYPEERINYILQDSGAKILLSEGDDLNEIIGPIGPIGPILKELPTYPAHLCYVIYTSGSTGKPKGVMVEHGSVVNILFDLFKRYPFGEKDIYLLKTSYVFDVSVTELFGWFLGGGRLALLEKGGEKDPHTILDTIAQFSISHINFVPSMFNVFLEILNPGNTGKLSGLKYIFLAGEAFLPWLVKKFQQFNLDIVLENIYGPTEATVYASQYSLARWDGTGNIPIGKPMQNTRLYILNRRDGLQPIGVVGELCISGIGLARGYLNKPGLTAETFKAFNRSYRPYRTYILYKTGDLARWLPDGNVEFLGRTDHQIKIRGFRVELGEIENRLLMHHEIKEAVVVAGERNADTYLCAYIVLNSPGTVDDISSFGAQLKRYLSRSLPDYMIPSYVMPVEAIPLTSSGKVDRKALPEPEVQASKTYAAPQDEIEEKLAEIWADVLGIDKQAIGIDNNFFELGGHSLKATIMAARVHKAFDIRLPLARIFKTPFIRGLAEYIKNTRKERCTAVTAAEENEYYALSFAQKRLYIIHQMVDIGTGYNMPTVVQLQGMVEKERLEHTFRQLIARHESLRTSFEMVDGKPIQKVHKNAPFEIGYHPLTPDPLSLIPDFIRPFDLSKAPLVRVGLIKEDNTKHILVVDMHHIISDGVSMGILMREFMVLYAGQALSPLRIQYKDYAQWQKEEKQSTSTKKQGDYWLKQLGGDIPIPELPVDYARPAVQQFEGDWFILEIDETKTAALKTFALKQEVTLYMVLLAVTFIFLSKISGQEDIIIGTIAAGRGHPDLENIIGMFVNTLALRSHPSGEKNLHTFLEEIKENTLAAFENQDYPFEELVEQVPVNRDTGRNPLFDIMFVLQNPDIPEIEIPGLKLSPYPYERKQAKFDLTINGHEAEGQLILGFEYSTTLFKAATIERFIGYFKRVLSAVPQGSAVRLADIEIISEQEKKQILMDFNDTLKEYPGDRTIHQLFEAQVEKTPDSVAVISMTPTAVHRANHLPLEHQVTYRELNKKSHQLAHLLREKGVTRDSIVGLMVERSLEMMKGILGILKAGGAYLPANPDYPEIRITDMLGDGHVDILMLQSIFTDRTDFECERIVLDDPSVYADGETIRAVENINKPHDLAYVMYTSGTTGKSKGVMVEHQNVVRLVINTNYTELNHETRILQTGATVFDAATFEMWGSLLNGGRLYLVTNDVILDADRLGQAIKENHINTLWLSAPLFNQLMRQGSHIFSTLEWLIVGGDVLSSRTINRVRQTSSTLKVVNGYGPTENTTFSVCYLIDRDFDTPIPIGKPISNSSAYILDKYNQLQPVGIFGELYVGGDGVSRGYLNTPELTAEKFKFNRSYRSYRSYKTGDLARWLPDGNIEFSGRFDQQLKIRGFRVEPGEIEKQLLKHQEVKASVVIARQNDKGDKYLCAYIVPDHWESSTVSGPLLREYLSKYLPDYMVPSHFMCLEAIPLNVNGKVDRKALPEPESEAAGSEYAPPQNEIQRNVTAIWEEELEVSPIGINDDFFERGGHSLKAIGVTNKIEKTFGVTIAIQDLFQHPTIAAISRLIENSRVTGSREIQKQPEQEHYELSYSQKRLWYICKTEPDNPLFNMPERMTLYEAVDETVVREVVEQLTARHESLRTAFKEINKEPVQVIEPLNRLKINLEVIDLSELPEAQREERRNRLVPGESLHLFNLEQAPLFRAKVVKCAEEEYDLVFNMHHIISDGWSMEILKQEFQRLYEAHKTGSTCHMEPLELQYKDYAAWQNQLLADETQVGQANEFWREQLSGTLPVLNLPYDFSRPPGSEESAAYRWVIPGELTLRLRTMAAGQRASLFMVLLAGFNLLLAQVTAQKDILIAIPAAARQHEALENIIGLFVNTLILRNSVNTNESFVDFFKRLQGNTFKVLEYQGIPLELICGQLKIKYPEVSVFFNMTNIGTSHRQNLENVDAYHIKKVQNAKFDIVCYLAEYKNGIEINCHYFKERFKPVTIEKLMDLYLKILDNISADPGKKTGEYSVTGKKKKLKRKK